MHPLKFAPLGLILALWLSSAHAATEDDYSLAQRETDLVAIQRPLVANHIEVLDALSHSSPVDPSVVASLRQSNDDLTLRMVSLSKDAQTASPHLRRAVLALNTSIAVDERTALYYTGLAPSLLTLSEADFWLGQAQSDLRIEDMEMSAFINGEE